MANKLSHARALFLDCEYQCWEGPPAGCANDIIRIGIVEANLENLTITRRASYLVRPDVYSISDFCMRLTGITDRAIRTQGRPFDKRINILSGVIGPASKTRYVSPWATRRSRFDRECLQSDQHRTRRGWDRIRA
ncbi:MAG TPA: hypothetical protein VHU89_12915 [Acidobacteriaceae bacterium]|jgi:DNA polymerase III epsilon subunit-like protein|nr:hypothetical protein [Acidobacteriaceae bacterium]